MLEKNPMTETTRAHKGATLIFNDWIYAQYSNKNKAILLIPTKHYREASFIAVLDCKRFP